MTLAEAIREFEQAFAKVKTSRKEDGSIMLHSGAVWPSETAPCLFISEALAIVSWHEAAQAWLPKSSAERVLIWVTKPEIRVYQMTMAPKGGTHRVVSDRYSVYSELALAGDLNGAPPR